MPTVLDRMEFMPAQFPESVTHTIHALTESQVQQSVLQVSTIPMTLEPVYGLVNQVAMIVMRTLPRIKGGQRHLLQEEQEEQHGRR